MLTLSGSLIVWTTAGIFKYKIATKSIGSSAFEQSDIDKFK